MLREILQRLETMRDSGPWYFDGGICCNIRAGFDVGEERMAAGSWLREQFPYWPEFSGVLDYPVQHPDMSPCQAYDESVEDAGWDRSTEYGAARYRLIDFLISRAEEQLKAEA